MSIDPITARINAFAQELDGLIRAAALEAVSGAFTGGGAPRVAAARAARPSRAARTRAPVRKATPAAPKAKAAPARAAAKPAPTRPKGTPSAAHLAQMDAAAVAYVKTNPGKRCEEIALALGVPSPDLKRRIALLIEAKKLHKTGNTRGTIYFAGPPGAGGAAPAPSKSTKRAKK